MQVASERGTLHVVIYEPVWDKAINCYLDEDLMQSALELFGKRVAVTGLVKYRLDGSAISIRADSFEAFPTQDELPKTDQIVGVLRNYT